MDRNRILEKIQKALNLSKDSGATPGEVAAALNSAQKMMAKYGVDEKELGAVGYGRERVQTAIQAGMKHPQHLAIMVSLIADAFGVRSVWQREIRKTDPNWTINYFGPEHRVAMAIYTHQVLYRAIEKGWAEALIKSPYLKKERGGRTGFYMGWIAEVRKQVHELAMTEEEVAGTDLVLKDAFPTLRTGKTSGTKGLYETAQAGRDAAGDFRLHRPMGGGAAERLRIGG